MNNAIKLLTYPMTGRIFVSPPSLFLPASSVHIHALLAVKAEDKWTVKSGLSGVKVRISSVGGEYAYVKQANKILSNEKA